MPSLDAPDNAISLAKIIDAAERIKKNSFRTPLLESPILNKILNARLFIKAEMLQRTGSFKFRGAHTKISRLSATARKRGVVAYSSGNHAQGVAYSANLYECDATIVMPKDAPKVKIVNTKKLGAEVILYDRVSENREDIGRHISQNLGATLIPPYDDMDVISGQGTIGLEIDEQLSELGIKADKIIVPCGGGGLVAGIASGISELSPKTEIWAVEPTNYDDTLRSLNKGARLSNSLTASTICDALTAPTPGKITFNINSQLLSGCLSVSDGAVAAAMTNAFELFKIIVEPGGAIALASVLNKQINIDGQVVVVICSGGNVDTEMFNQILGEKIQY